MATVENVRLDIKASATKPDYSDILYSYELHPSEADCAAQREFVVTVGLWGEDMLDDDVLETDLDMHTVQCSDTAPAVPIKVERGFEVETKLLDEDLVGDDEVFLIVEANSGTERASGKSNTVVGYF